eukprot:1157153-Pelagomonas_calceolata.AAC.1
MASMRAAAETASNAFLAVSTSCASFAPYLGSHLSGRRGRRACGAGASRCHPAWGLNGGDEDVQGDDDANDNGGGNDDDDDDDDDPCIANDLQGRGFKIPPCIADDDDDDDVNGDSGGNDDDGDDDVCGDSGGNDAGDDDPCFAHDLQDRGLPSYTADELVSQKQMTITAKRKVVQCARRAIFTDEATKERPTRHTHGCPAFSLHMCRWCCNLIASNKSHTA